MRFLFNYQLFMITLTKILCRKLHFLIKMWVKMMAITWQFSKKRISNVDF